MVALLRVGVGYLAPALLAFFLSSAAAWAHATLIRATPSPDRVAEGSTDRIELEFNEPVELLGLRLLDAAGDDRSPQGTPESADGRIVWRLPAPLRNGRYLVSWRAESLDGHVIGGAFAFGVGGSMPAGMGHESHEAHGTGMPDRWSYLGLHALSRLLALLAIGSALFHLILAQDDPDGWLGRTTRRLAAGGMAALAFFIAAEGTMRAGLPMIGTLSHEALSAALDAPNLAWRGLGLLGLLLIAISEGRKLQGFGAALATLSMADSGHVLSMLPQGAGHALMLVHGLAAAAWMGAIAPLRHALQRDAGAATLALFRRFQTYGGLAMGVTMASALVLTWLLLPHISDLWQSDYGLRLSAKLAAVAVMVLIAAGNRIILTRRALAGHVRVRTLLCGILALDVVAAAMATVLAVGLSLGSPPARILEVAVADGSYDGTLSFEPGRAGDNDLGIVLAAKAGSPADPREVEVRVTAPGLEPMVRKATRVGVGRYAVHQLPLWKPAQWNVELHVLVDDFTSLELSTPVTLR